jgi:hypothetical protein
MPFKPDPPELQLELKQIGPSGATYVPKKQKEQETAQEISKDVQKDEALRMNKLKGLMQTVDFLEKKYDEIPDIPQDWKNRITGGPKKWAEIQIQKDTKGKAYTKMLTGFRPILSRGLGDVGNLSEQEQKAAMELIAIPTDTKNVGKEAFKNFKQYVMFKSGIPYEKVIQMTTQNSSEGSTPSKQVNPNDPLGVL